MHCREIERAATHLHPVLNSPCLLLNPGALRPPSALLLILPGLCGVDSTHRLNCLGLVEYSKHPTDPRGAVQSVPARGLTVHRPLARQPVAATGRCRPNHRYQGRILQRKSVRKPLIRSLTETYAPVSRLSCVERKGVEKTWTSGSS